MSEWYLVWLYPVRMLMITAFGLCYLIGGRRWKWIRRFLGSLIFAASVIVLSVILKSFTWRLIPAFGCLAAGLTLGYSGDSMPKKIINRFVYGVVIGFSGLVIGIAVESFLYGLFQLILSIFGSVYLGCLNPDKDAVDEEALVATLSVLAIPFMV